jgi:hypothetical protein
MKITQKRLKEIIAEEMSKLNETFGRHMAGETDKAAGGYYERKIFSLATSINTLIDPNSSVDAGQVANEIRELVKELKGADPMNFEGNMAQAFKMALRPNFMQESKKKQTKRK